MTEDSGAQHGQAGPSVAPGEPLLVSGAWSRWRGRVDLAAYDRRWDDMEADGRSVHDEADFVDGLGAQIILDAGCGTGRVAAELARRGRQVVGVDSDADMLAYAGDKPEPVRWEYADLATMSLPEWFDLAVMAGNILIYVEPEHRPRAVANTSRHLKLDGLLVMGSSETAGCRFDDVDRWCDDAGMRLVQQFSTWDRLPFDDGDYRVSIHRRLG